MSRASNFTTISSLSGAATTLIQNFQLQNMLKEAQIAGAQLSSSTGSSANLSNTNAPSSTSGTSSANAGGGTSLLDLSRKLNEAELCRICSILCTVEPNMFYIYDESKVNKVWQFDSDDLLCVVCLQAEYCLETTQQLEDKLKEKVGGGGQRINFDAEKECFAHCISNCIQLLVQDLENSCEAALTAMARVSWSTITAVGDQSSYVTALW